MEFCNKTARIWQIVGNALLILKIAIPILIIVLGSIDFGKAVISSDDKAIKKSGSALFKRVFAGIIIFFIPTIIKLAFNMVSGFNDDIKKEYDNCMNCITSPNKECEVSSDKDIYK